MFQSDEFRRGIKPLIIINSMFTTGLVEYFNDSKINAIGLIYACSTILVYIYMIHQFKFLEKSFEPNQPYLIKLTFELSIYSHYLYHFITIITGLLRRKKVKSFLLQMETCIRTMNQLKIPSNLSKCYWLQYYHILIMILLFIVLLITDINWLIIFGHNFMSYLRIYYIERYPLFLLSVTEITFMFWMRFIKMKFGQLNELLKSMLTTTNNSPQHKRMIKMRNNWKNDSASADIHRIYESNENVVKIKIAQKLHLELMKCAKNINNAYSINILLSISMSTILITIMSYNLYNNIIIGIGRRNINAIISLSYWIFIYMFKIIMISHLCATTSAEVCLLIIHYFLFHYKTNCLKIVNNLYVYILHASNIGDIICELYIPTTSKEFRTEISDFTLQLIQNPLSFTCCGFFQLNHTLISKVIVSVTTYLVILIQVGNLPPQVFNDDLIS